MEEQWKPIDEYEGLYEVSNIGNIKNVKRNTILSKLLATHGYFQVVLSNKGIKNRLYVHRLVALSFIDNPELKKTVNHINGIKTDNRIENLEWSTHSENVKHAYDNGLSKPAKYWTGKYGKDNPKSKPIIQKSINGNIINRFNSINEAARLMGFSISSISACINKKQNTHKGFIWVYDN